MKKPVVVEAFELGKDNLPDWFMDKVSSNEISLYGTYRNLQSCQIKTLEGVMFGETGDYIIKGIKGEIYPCKPDIFHMSYDAIETEDEFQERINGLSYNGDE